MSWKVCLVLVLAGGCHSSKTTSSAASPSPAPRVAVHRNVSLQCAHEAVAAVDPLVDHVAGIGGEMWDQLHGKMREFQPPPGMDRAAFVSFVTTPEGKDWLRRSGLFDGWYYGMVQLCETRAGS